MGLWETLNRNNYGQKIADDLGNFIYQQRLHGAIDDISKMQQNTNSAMGSGIGLGGYNQNNNSMNLNPYPNWNNAQSGQQPTQGGQPNAQQNPQGGQPNAQQNPQGGQPNMLSLISNAFSGAGGGQPNAQQNPQGGQPTQGGSYTQTGTPTTPTGAQLGSGSYNQVYNSNNPTPTQGGQPNAQQSPQGGQPNAQQTTQPNAQTRTPGWKDTQRNMFMHLQEQNAKLNNLAAMFPETAGMVENAKKELLGQYGMFYPSPGETRLNKEETLIGDVFDSQGNTADRKIEYGLHDRLGGSQVKTERLGNKDMTTINQEGSTYAAGQGYTPYNQIERKIDSDPTSSVTNFNTGGGGGSKDDSKDKTNTLNKAIYLGNSYDMLEEMNKKYPTNKQDFEPVRFTDMDNKTVEVNSWNDLVNRHNTDTRKYAQEIIKTVETHPEVRSSPQFNEAVKTMAKDFNNLYQQKDKSKWYNGRDGMMRKWKEYWDSAGLRDGQIKTDLFNYLDSTIKLWR